MARVAGPDLPPGSVIDRRPPDGTEWSFDGRVLEGVRFRRVKDGWDWLHFRSCTFVDCTFDRCDINWQLGATTLDPDAASSFQGCDFVRCNFERSVLRWGRLESCTFTNCNLKTHLRSVDLVNNRFVGIVQELTIEGREHSLVGPSRHRPNLIVGNDFTQADLRGVELRAEVPAQDQLWPADSNIVLVDRWPERMLVLEQRLDRTGEDQELLAWLRGHRVDQQPEFRQTSYLVRLDDPVATDTSLRAYRALLDVDPAEASA